MLCLLVSNLCFITYTTALTGGANATAMAKFVQFDGHDWKMALISPQGKFVLPEAYFGVSHGHIDDLQLESASVSGQVEPWSKIDVGQRVKQYHPKENKLTLSNGKQYTYKALVLAPGLDHRVDGIEGLPEMR